MSDLFTPVFLALNTMSSMDRTAINVCGGKTGREDRLRN